MACTRFQTHKNLTVDKELLTNIPDRNVRNGIRSRMAALWHAESASVFVQFGMCRMCVAYGEINKLTNKKIVV